MFFKKDLFRGGHDHVGCLLERDSRPLSHLSAGVCPGTKENTYALFGWRILSINCWNSTICEGLYDCSDGFFHFCLKTV
ncbi:Nacht And Wd Repeat Domain-Containing Protein 2 [Manis pentadactyla]|nr:Nacht And Wd Repeat Domain-Containing Protein 2 [Manis pentadactyla]